MNIYFGSNKAHGIHDGTKTLIKAVKNSKQKNSDNLGHANKPVIKRQ